MKLRLASPEALIDINGLGELSSIREEKGVVVIGALTRHDQLAGNPIVRAKLPLLAEAASMIADQQVRNRGTIGGSLAHADPAADLPTACTAADATIVTASLNGSRSIKSTDFFQSYLTTSLGENEMIREIHVPAAPPRSGSAFLKLTKGHNDFAVVAVAAQVTLDMDRVCRAASLVLGGVASTPIHAHQSEKLLVGSRVDDEAIGEAAEMAPDGLKPISDLHASSEYRVEMMKLQTKKALRKAADRAQGGIWDG
jgi:CO/xanthine dehydrogenase FAD-binding subunit